MAYYGNISFSDSDEMPPSVRSSVAEQLVKFEEIKQKAENERLKVQTTAMSNVIKALGVAQIR